jgi:hypothetical protein
MRKFCQLFTGLIALAVTLAFMGCVGGPDLYGTRFHSIAELGTWLAAQPANTAATRYDVKLNVNSLGGDFQLKNTPLA